MSLIKTRGKLAVLFHIVIVAGTLCATTAVADPYADAVDTALTKINDYSCNRDCGGQPKSALGAPDYEQQTSTTAPLTMGSFGQPTNPFGTPTLFPGTTTASTIASLGSKGTLGLRFVDELCAVDDDVSTPDIIVYEGGSVQTEDFSVDAARVGQGLAGRPVSSTRSGTFNAPVRELDLTAVIGGAGYVDRIKITDIDNAYDSDETSVVTKGADIDAVECFSSRVKLTMEGSPDTVNELNLVTYTFTVTNTGAVPLTEVVLRDTIPLEMRFTSVNLSSLCSHQGGLDGGMLWCNLGTIEPGASVEVRMYAWGLSTDVEITVTHDALVFTSVPGVSATATETTTILSAEAELIVNQHASADTVWVGDEVTYTATVRNYGPGNATNVMLVDTLPAGAEFVSAIVTLPSNRNIDCDPPIFGRLICALGELYKEEYRHIDVTLRMLQPGVVTNTIAFTSDQVDPGAYPNISQVETTVNELFSVSDNVNLTYDRLLNFGPLPIGETAQGTVTISNTRSTPLSIGPAQAPLSPPFQVLNPSACFGVTLAAGQTCRLLIEFAPTKSGDFQDGFNLDFGSDVIPISVTGAGTSEYVPLTLEMSVDNSEIWPGQYSTFTIVVQNWSDDQTVRVEVEDKLPAGLRVPAGISPDPSRGHYGGLYGDTWVVGELEPMQAAQLEIPVEPTSSDIGCVENTARASIVSTGVTGPGIGGRPPVRASKFVTTPGDCADLAMAYAVHHFSGDGEIGDDVTWHLLAENLGPGSFTGPIHFEFQLPTGARFISVDTSSPSLGFGTYNGIIRTVPPGPIGNGNVEAGNLMQAASCTQIRTSPDRVYCQVDTYSALNCRRSFQACGITVNAAVTGNFEVGSLWDIQSLTTRDPDPENNSINWSRYVERPSNNVDLQLDLGLIRPRSSSKPFIFRAVVSNAGPDDATSVEVTFEWESIYQYDDSRPRCFLDGVQPDNSCKASVGSIPAGGSTVAEILLKLPLKLAPGVSLPDPRLHVTATATSSDNEISLGNESDSEFVELVCGEEKGKQVTCDFR